MKILDIALKDLTRSFRSAFAVVFMFGIPLLVTGMFYFMFGKISQEEGFSLPATDVIVANLDEGSPDLYLGEGLPAGIQAESLGELVANVLQQEEFASLLSVTLAPDAAAARAGVNRQEAQVAILIPPDFSDRFTGSDQQAVLEIYRDPDASLGPAVVRSILNGLVDGLSGARIAVNVTLSQSGDFALIQPVLVAYLADSNASAGEPAALLDLRPPNAVKEAGNPLLQIIGPIMGGMMIFYAFFTGTSTAQGILNEEEGGTLPRLFTTPTSQAAILSGKFLAVFLTVLVQVIVLIVAARLIFGIQWGDPLPVALMAAGTILSAATFGICLNSLLKSARQGGLIYGGVLTMSGMVGMIGVFAMSSPAGARLGDTVSLVVPQGWAARSMFQALKGAPTNEILWTTLILLAWSIIFFAIGVWRFNRRYA